MAVEFSTEQYQFSHGRAPRGFGMWAFYFGGSGRWTAEAQFCPMSCSYGEAKKWAARQARALGCDRVVVAT